MLLNYYHFDELSTTLTVNIAELRKAMLDFKITDGMLPKSAMTNPDVLTAAMQFISGNEQLNIEYNVGGIFADYMAVFDINVAKHKRAEEDGNQTYNTIQPGESAAAAQPPDPNAGSAG